MKLTIYETPNGCIIVEGEHAAESWAKLSEFQTNFWSFNSLDKAVAHVRNVLVQWRSNKLNQKTEEECREN